MNANEFQLKLHNKNFKSTDGGFEYNFIPENTLQVYHDMQRSVHYTPIETDDGKYIIDHKNLLGSEPFIIEVISLNFPITLSLTKRFSNNFVNTWVEVQ